MKKIIIIIIIILFVLNIYSCSKMVDKYINNTLNGVEVLEEKIEIVDNINDEEGIQNINIQKEDTLTNITYDQLMISIDKYINMSQVADMNEKNRYLGQSTDNLVIFELIGTKLNIESVSLVVGIPKDAPDIKIRNLGILLRVVKNIDNTWNESSDWISNAIKITTNNGGSEILIRNNIKYELSTNREIGMILLYVENKK